MFSVLDGSRPRPFMFMDLNGQRAMGPVEQGPGFRQALEQGGSHQHSPIQWGVGG